MVRTSAVVPSRWRNVKAVIAGRVQRGRQLVASTACIPLVAAGARAQLDVEGTFTVPVNTTIAATVIWTKDGAQIGGAADSFTNASGAPLTFNYRFTAPPGTNDRQFGATFTPLALSSNQILPAGQVADYGVFLASNGFASASSALVSPLAIGGTLGGTSTSLFAVLGNVSAFAAVANAALFPVGATLTTNANGQLAGVPGLTFFTDASRTTLYASGQIQIVGVVREFSTVPEPSAFVLVGAGVAGLLVGAARRKHHARRLDG